MSSVPMHDETSHPLNVNVSPIQSLPNENLNITPIRNRSPSLERQRRETGSPNTLMNVTNAQNQDMEEEPLLYSQASLIELRRSDFIPDIELAMQQDKYLRKMEVGGVLGTQPVLLNKAQLLSDRVENQEALNKHVVGNTNYLRKDGIFVTSEEEAKTVVNVQRLEQRLLWENKKDWFRKDNGELIMDSEVFNERITKMRDVSISQNPNLRIIKKSAYLSERENQKKTQYFKLDILVGKVYINKHPQFINEDEKAVELKGLIKEYKEKADLTIIPHLRKQLEQLNQEHQKYTAQYDIPPREAEIIEREIRLVQTMLEKETASTQKIMESIYKTWEEIKKIRAANNFSSSTVRLNVRQYKSHEYTDEYELFLSQQEYSKANDFSGRILPVTERTRRRLLAQYKVWVKIYINGVYVGCTKKVNLDWPSFEVNFLEKFQIYLFRKPASIEFRIYMGRYEAVKIDSVMVDIPGETANTLTSTSTIYREKPFAKKVPLPRPKTANPKTPNKSDAKENINKPPLDLTFSKDNKPDVGGSPSPIKGQKSPEQPKTGRGENTPNKKPNAAAAGTTTPGRAGEEIEPEPAPLAKTEIGGVISYKAEWFGFGTTLPPATIDKLGGRRQEGIKMKNYYDQALDNLVDLNDPRNELAIQQLKQMKNQQMQEILKKDAMMPLSDIESLRHRLYKLKFQKLELAMRKIPLTEAEIYNNYDFMQFITDYEKEIQELEGEREYQTQPLLKENLLDVDKFPYTQETRKRLIKYRKRIYVLQQELQSQKLRDTGNILSLKSVVNEFYFEEGINPLAEFFKSVFAQRGKLRPVRKTQVKVKSEKTERADVLIHVVKGKDIPARAKAAGQVKAFRENAMGAGAMSMGYSPRGMMSQYPGSGYPGGGSQAGFYPNQGYGSQPGYGSPPRNQSYPGYGQGGYEGDPYNNNPAMRSPGGGYGQGGYGDGYGGYNSQGGMRSPGGGYGPGGYNSQGGMRSPGGGYGPGGYDNQGGMRSPPYGSPNRNQQLGSTFVPGYPLEHSQRLAADMFANDMNRNPNMPEDHTMRQAMGSNFDTRMAIQGGIPTDNLVVERVLPFLEVRLHDPDNGTLYTIKTETFEGTYPEWNDNLVLPLKLSTMDFNYDLTRNPENTRAIIYFNLFDLVSSVSRQRETTNRYSVLIEKRYLGAFSIPLVTLFQYPKQSASFKIQRPLFLFGYFNMKPVFSSDLNITNILADPFTPTYVTLSITMDPLLDLPPRNAIDYYSGAENPQLLLNGSNWLKNLKKNSKFATRHIKLWGAGINNLAKLESRFIPRYLTPLVPPIDVIDENAYTKAARYVSLIPFRNETQIFKDLPDLWATCQEFLDVQAGGHEEHAVLLCNYFMYIDQQLGKTETVKNYLLLCKAVPEGEAVYVMRRDIKTNEVEIWNAVYGDPYFFKRNDQFFSCFHMFTLNKTSVLDREVSDNDYPIQEIGCVINNENVWVNIQADVSPSHVIFDIENRKNWMPFLGEKSYKSYFPENKIETIQPELKYEKTPIEFVQRLEKKIQSEIAKRIEAERSSNEGGKRAYRTKWERRFGDRLRNILLTSFESFKYRTRTTGTKSTLAGGQNIGKSKEDIDQIKDDILNEVPEGGDIYGFPLNMPYTDVERIWQEVRNTDIHNIQSDDVEYVLAVGAYAYDHFVLSVWVFVGVIFNKTNKR